jgi:hypothetical protein
LIVFNIYKSLNPKAYLLEHWNDLVSHIKVVGNDSIKVEMEYVEKNGSKLSKEDYKKLQKIYSYKKDPKGDLLH